MLSEVHRHTGTNRQLIADLCSEMGDDRLETASLCAGWSCRDVLGHLVMSVDLSFPRFLLEVARDWGRVSATSDRLALIYGDRPVRDLVRTLRTHSDAAVSPPGVGRLGPFTDSCIHMRDIAIPLGMAVSPPVEDWAMALAFLTTPRARAAGFLPRKRLDGLALHASDHPWSSGSGAAVVGSSEALALSISGRPVLLHELSGDGVSILRGRIVGSDDG